MRVASYHAMAGYAYINPLAGLGYTHREVAAHHGMVGYAYINPLAWLSPTGGGGEKMTLFFVRDIICFNFAALYFNSSMFVRNITLLLIVFLVCGCSEEKGRIEGVVRDADGQTLYLENVAVDGVVVLDSVTLNSDGAFHFTCLSSPAPEFYRLRLGRQAINLSIDSTEVVTVDATAATFATDYTVSHSMNCEKLRELTLLQQALQSQINAIIASPQLRISEVEDSITIVVNAYKDHVKTHYIYAAPDKTYAYFALFQTMTVGYSSGLIINPVVNDDDLKAYAAVATSWDTFYPNSTRQMNLHNIVIEHMRNSRIVQAQENTFIDPDKIDTSGIVNITLNDADDHPRSLSDLVGHVVLLDFCAFAQDDSNQRTIALREVYNKYHADGLEIYQVSVDDNEHFWKTQTAALPWVSVRAPQGLDSEYLVLYNVQVIPTFFLLTRDGTPYKRDAQIEDLEEEIKSLL